MNDNNSIIKKNSIFNFLNEITMKKLFFALCMMILCGSNVAMAQAKSTETKASMLKSIRNTMAKEMIKDGSPKEKSEKFADCFTKALGEKLSLDELKIFYKLNDVKPGQAPPKELIKQAEKMGLREKMETVGTDCGSLLQ
ncbi:cytochrome c556 [Chryseobacterium ginsenosidimutans]|uniref:hypothetical protein n=1 Tax=Chryseobacterium ginsenosidimutans TaxID=687846 RepID=UPI00216A9495|nr:hypothetical protein [Chryseobacterium ginsenosidimutans]MCS3868298.1 cytochrome c556 [Chryseobacterium ginsenosidimutans]